MSKISFPNKNGEQLVAKLEIPEGSAIKAYALFAHCFTCTKDIFVASRIANILVEQGIAVLRFDFTGLGESEGDFANTNFSSNVEDLVAAVQFLRDEYQAPSILIGHSLGGSAVLHAAQHIPEAKAVVTIGSPSDIAHVTHNFKDNIDEIKTNGIAEVNLVGRPFTIKKQFLDDVTNTHIKESVRHLRKALLVMHAPTDQTVGIENASDLFSWAKHPKSYISLDNADHLLSRKKDVVYAGHVIAAWVEKYL